MNLHKSELGWTEYVIMSPISGFPTNHHYTKDGLLGKRVTPQDATHAVVVEVERVDETTLKITSTEVRELSNVLTFLSD